MMYDKEDKEHRKIIDYKIESLYNGARGRPNYEDALGDVFLDLVENDTLYTLDEDGFYSYIHMCIRHKSSARRLKEQRERKAIAQMCDLEE